MNEIGPNSGVPGPKTPPGTHPPAGTTATPADADLLLPRLDPAGGPASGVGLATAIDQVTEGVVITDADGRIQYVNQSFIRMTGYAAQEVIGQNPRVLKSGRHDLAFYKQMWDTIQAGKVWHGEMVNRRKDGSDYAEEMNITPVRDAAGAITNFIAVKQDVTARRAGENAHRMLVAVETEAQRGKEALQASEERYRLLFERNLAGVLRTALAEGRILDCNLALGLIVGVSPSELIGTSALDYYYCAADRAQIIQTLREQKVLTNRELKLRRRDGQPVWVLANFGLVVDEGDCGVLEITLVDITDRKQAEERLRGAKEIAERANHAKSAFLANMSHEIRTPMNGILGMAGLLLESELEARQRQRAETIRDSAAALLDVLNDLLDFSKIEAHKLELEEAAFDLRNVVEGVADLIAVKAQEKRLEVLCFIEPQVPTRLLGDAGRLRQVLLNLAGNAVKFTAAGEVSIRVKLETDDVAGGIRFEVSDTGIGVPSDKLPLLFQPFSQVDASTSRRYGGTGLGLSIVRMLVDIMGGRVGCQSEQGKGSCFWFALPLEQQSAVERPRPLTLAGRRFLVVDDNARGRGLIMELLALWKAGAEQVGNAEAALDLLRSAARPAARPGDSAAGLLPGVTGGPYDAILVDLEMPGVSGDQLGVLIQQQPEWARTPMVLLTPLSQAADAARWRRLGFAGHIGKPVKQGELGTLLATILGYGPAPLRPRPQPQRSRTDRDKRARLRLLIVEDNKVNQEVALGILENLGYRAEVVADGRSALSALSRKDYDLVLMDCQLPGMDGYEASRRIRRPDTAVRNHDIPIIAATAHALAGDRERCLAAGMNGYVSKPLKPDALEQAIEEWTGGMPAAVGPAAPPRATANVKPSATFDSEDFVDRLMGNQEIAQRIIRGFVEDIPRQIALLAEAVNNGDARQVRLVAHSIKGAAANVCGEEVRKAAWELEQNGAADNLTAAAVALPGLSASFERVRPIMESFCREDPAGC